MRITFPDSPLRITASPFGETAVAAHDRAESYRHERDCYLRLSRVGVIELCGHHVPRLIQYDDELLILEMTVVTRPHVLDFGGAYLDRPPDYPAEILDEWMADKEEQFGSDWPHVQTILSELRRYGIHLADVNPGNIAFLDD